MRIIVCPPDKEPEVVVVNDNLESLQSIVKGNIEAVPLYPRVCLFCNEEGMWNLSCGNKWSIPFRDEINMPGCCNQIHGTFFLSRNNAEGEQIDLTDKDIETLLNRMKG